MTLERVDTKNYDPRLDEQSRLKFPLEKCEILLYFRGLSSDRVW